MVTLGMGFGAIDRGGDILPPVLEDVLPFVVVLGVSEKKMDLLGKQKCVSLRLILKVATNFKVIHSYHAKDYLDWVSR